MDHIQLRSDTIIASTPEILGSILTADYGDWSYNQDPTVLELEAYAAELLGKEAAAYVPSGVFGNQCSLLTAGKPGQELIISDRSHIIVHENGSAGRISRMMTKTVHCPLGYLNEEILLKCFRKSVEPKSLNTSVVVLENPTFEGLIHPINSYHQTAILAKKHKAHVHSDCARLFNAVAELKVDPKELLKECDSANFCLSKGLLAPVGSVVVGSKEFIKRFQRNRALLGGVMRKPGVVAAAGLLALKKMRLQVWKDNEIARTLSSGMVNLGWLGLQIPVETNLIWFKVLDETVNEAELSAFLKNNGVFCNLAAKGVSRFVIHHYIREKEVNHILALLQQFRETHQ